MALARPAIVGARIAIATCFAAIGGCQCDDSFALACRTSADCPDGDTCVQGACVVVFDASEGEGEGEGGGGEGEGGEGGEGEGGEGEGGEGEGGEGEGGEGEGGEGEGGACV